MSLKLALLTVSFCQGMDYQNDREWQHYWQDVNRGQGQAMQISAHYNYDSSASMSSTGFKVPQLPQHSRSKSTTRPLTNPLYLTSEPTLALSSQPGPQYSSASVNSNSYDGYESGPHPSSSIPQSFASPGFALGFQPQSFIPHQHTPHNMASLSMSSNYDTSQIQQSYGFTTAPRPNPTSSINGSNMYDAMPIDPQSFQISEFAAVNGYHDYSSYQQARQQTSTPQSNISLREAFERYQLQTKEIFTLVRNNQLEPAANLLLQISTFLIGNVETLGLERDDRRQYEDRMRLWDTFNLCWLTALHLQHKTTQFMIHFGQNLAPGQSIMDASTLETLGQHLVKLCDSIEKTGLIDYQMGVAEERIVDLLLKCLDTLDPQSPDTPRASASNTIGNRR